MDTVAQLKLFLEPKSLAVIGAQPYSGEQAFNIIENLAYSGYEGQVYPVNPNYSEVLGKKSYPTLADVPGAVDLAIISTPRTVVPEIIRQCAHKGIKAAIVVVQGFADATDEEGKRLHQELVEAAREGGVRILGPNTLGTANAFVNFNTSFLRLMGMRKLPVAVISQSGMFFGNLGRLSLIGKGIDLGNACDIDCAEALEYFDQDPETRVIVLHIEGVTDGKRFREVAHRVAKKKPVLALKTGRGEQAARAAQSHTGSLVGRDEVWEAVFKQSGIMRVDDIDELGDLVRAFLFLPLIGSRKIGVVTVTGGFGIIAMDACAKYGLEVVELSPGTIQRLKDISPPWLKVGNPLDIMPTLMTSPHPFGETLRAVLTEVLRDPGLDAVVLIAGAWLEQASPAITEVIQEMVDAFPDKAIVWYPCDGWLYDIPVDELARKLEHVGKAAVFSSPDRAVRALARLAEYSEFRDTTD
jgi:acetyltransferase